MTPSGDLHARGQAFGGFQPENPFPAVPHSSCIFWDGRTSKPVCRVFLLPIRFISVPVHTGSSSHGFQFTPVQFASSSGLHPVQCAPGFRFRPGSGSHVLVHSSSVRFGSRATLSFTATAPKLGPLLKVSGKKSKDEAQFPAKSNPGAQIEPSRAQAAQIELTRTHEA